MDSFETILEQLKLAQKQGKDAVSGRIETIADKLGSLVDEATATVKETLSRETEELFPISELRTALEDLNRRADEEAEEKAQLAQRLQEAEGRLEAATPSTAGLSLDLLRGLDSARSQSELLRELLPALCDSVARAAVLVIRGGDVNAWSGIGFADGEKLREWRCSTADSPALARLVADQCPVSLESGQDPVFDGWLEHEETAGNGLLVPVCLRSQLMGCVYVDDGGEGPWDPEAVQGMVAVACWMIDTLHARQTVPTPMLAEVLPLSQELPGVDAFEEEKAVVDSPPLEEAEEDEPIEEASPALELDDEETTEAEPEVEFEPEVSDEPEDEEAVAEAPEEEIVVEPIDETFDESPDEAGGAEHDDYDPSATMRIEVATEPEVVPPEVHEQETLVEEEPPEPPAVVEEAEEEAEEEVVVTAMPVTPPPPLEVEDKPPQETDLSPEEAAQHEEARRFARLLISEIKLYNEEEVERGRLGKDLYPRLREDIDRSREMYEKRISEGVRAVTDYFDQELIRILAEGDADALGM